jgi:tetratricopeptide (TPR) repeat protein
MPWAQRAHQLDPDNGAYRTTLGVAQYRAGQYQEAVATLTPRASPRAASAVRLSPTDLAFLTMAHHQLGQYAEAQAWLERLRRLQRERVSYDEWYDDDADVQSFLREVEVLLQGA